MITFVSALLGFSSMLVLGPVMSQAETPEPVTPSVQEIDLGTADAPAPEVEVVPADESPAPTATAEATPGAEESLEPVEPADESAPATDEQEEPEAQPTPTPTQPAPDTPSESANPAPAPLSELEPDQPLPLPAGSQTLVLDETQTIGFSSAGISWVGEAPLNGVALQIRVKDAQTGEWSEWTDLSVNRSVVSNPDMPDLRQGTDPYWFGTSQGIEVAVTILPGTEISDLKITLIDPKKVEQDTVTQPSSTGSAGAAVPMPAIHTRAQWGADESKMGWTHQYMPTIKAATLHHSADGNNYSQADVPGMMRSIYHYQAVTLGWGDIGYNVVVDKFGRAWEGRSGGLNTAVVGAHAGGFNQSTFGVSMLGNYDLVNVPASTREMVAQLIAWKLGQYGVNPQGSVQLTQVGGAGTTARWTPGTTVTMPTIFGHRDVGRTACPGQYGYAALPGIRGRVAEIMNFYGTGPSTSLVRTPENPTVYLISGNSKSAVPNHETLQRLAPLGPVSYTSQHYLDGLASRGTAGRFVRGPDQTIYFVASGYRLRVGSCALMAEYGGGCAPQHFVDLDQGQISKFWPGPDLTQRMNLTDGAKYVVSNGKIHEIADETALIGTGYAAIWANTLHPDALAGYSVGAPIVRAGSVVRKHATNEHYLLAANAYYQVTSAHAWLQSKALGGLSARSFSQLQAGGTFASVASNEAGSTNYALTPSSKYEVPAAWGYPASRVVPALPHAALNQYQDKGALPVGGLVADASGALHVVGSHGLRYVPNWVVLNATGKNPASATTLPTDDVAAIPKQDAYLTPGRAYVSPVDGRIYLIDGADKKIYVPNWSRMSAYGFPSVANATKGALDPYQTKGGGLGYLTVCAGTSYLATDGGVRQLDQLRSAVVAETPTQLSSTTCGQLNSKPAVSKFVRTNDGSIWLFDQIGLRHVQSWSRLVALGGDKVEWTLLNPEVVNLIPKGPPA